MSNRLTFSLASLTLIFALVFSAMPVLAHTGDATHNTDTTGHAEVESITPADTVINASGRITAIVTFKLAEDASDDTPQTVHAITSPSGIDAADDFSIVDSTGAVSTTLEIIDVREIDEPIDPDSANNVVGVKGVYEIVLRPSAVNTYPAADGVYTVSVADLDPRTLVGDPTEGAGGELEITLDGTQPTVASITMQAKAGEDYQDEWSRAFEVEVTVSDGEGSGIKVDTLGLKAEPDILTFSDNPIRRPEENKFVFSASIKDLAAADADETMATDVVVTASVSDMAGNMSDDSASGSMGTVKIAARSHADRAPGKPGKPTAMEGTGDAAGTVTITWTAPTDTGNPELTGYFITEHYTDASGTEATKRFPDGDSTINATSYTIPPEGATETRVPAGMYTFTVTAVNSVGETVSDASDSITIEPPTDHPPMFADATAVFTVTVDTTVSLILPAATDTEDDADGTALKYSIDADTPLPDDLDFDADGRVVSGMPTDAGVVTVRYVATDSAEQTDSMLITFTVEPAPTPPITIPDPPTFGSATVSVPALTVGKPISIGTGTAAKSYISLPLATGGTGDLKYTLWVGLKDITTSGYNGLSLDDVNVGLKGTPLAEDPTGTLFEWRATDAMNLSAKVTFTVVVNPPDDVTQPEEKAKATFSGTLSLTARSVVTVTFDKAVTGLTAADFDVDGGSIPAEGIRPKTVTAPTVANTVWEVAVDPNPFADSVSITIAATSAVAQPAATNGSLITKTPEGMLSSITAATGADDTKPFVVTLTFAAALPTGVNVAAADLMVTPVTAKAGTPTLDVADSKMWHVLITPTAGMDTKIELSAAGKLKFSYAGAALTVKKKATPSASDLVSTDGKLTGFSVSAESYVLLVRSKATVQGIPVSVTDAQIIEWAGMPNLQALFYSGGSLQLSRNKTPKLDHDAKADTDARDAAVRDLILTEVMWARNTALIGKAGELDHQWIEIYNPLKVAVGGVTVETKAGRPPLSTTGDVVQLDMLSNQVGAGWPFEGLGQDGSDDMNNLTNDTKVNFVSMYRNNRAGDKHGWVKGHWSSSTEVAVTGHIGTPGRGETKTAVVVKATSVPRSPFVINEFGIGTSDGEDWVELRNVTESAQNLKNLLLTSVTGLDKEAVEFHFHDKGLEVPAKGVVLIASTDPLNSDIAAGVNLEIAADNQAKRGATSLYVVRDFDLPTGKFNLILRKDYNNKPGDFLGKKLDKVIDAIGSLKVDKDTANFNTDFWPLNGTGGPHGDVIEGLGQDFKAGTVYIRKNAGGGTGEHHLGKIGYIGVGYDRTASATDENGGTPGYDNGASKDKIAGLTTGDITISEIMIDTGPARQSLPQWIEFHNSSMTQAVNLNGWKLHIENAANGTGELETNTFSATLTLGNVTISPNQTVLIVTNTGRVSDPDHFPSTRVINLWTTKAHRDALEMTRRTDPVLSATGFNVTLADKDNVEVDSAGNLDGNRRTRDDIAWALPVGEDDGRRSSLIRVYDAGVAIDGTMAEAWVLADQTNLAFAISQTYYGDPGDYGTPGFRAGGPLPVSLSKFRPERLDDGSIRIAWVTESELNNAGFNILRSETKDGEFKQINTKLIAGKGTTSERSTYTYTDPSAKPNVVYYYQIQDVSIDGKVTTLRETRLKGHISAAGKLTTTWGELKALQ